MHGDIIPLCQKLLLAATALRFIVVTPSYNRTMSRLTASFGLLSPKAFTATPIHIQRLAVCFALLRHLAVIPTALGVPPQTIYSLGVMLLLMDILHDLPETFYFPASRRTDRSLVCHQNPVLLPH